MWKEECSVGGGRSEEGSGSEGAGKCDGETEWRQDRRRGGAGGAGERSGMLWRTFHRVGGVSWVSDAGSVR